MIIAEQIDHINIDHIAELKTDNVPEGLSVDYKLSLKLDDIEGARRLATDICSFINTLGGHIIVGISEKNGFIDEIVGTKILDVDKMTQRIEQICRESIDPPYIQMRTSALRYKDNYIYIIELPPSSFGLHRIKTRGNKFYGRNNVGNYEMTMQEINLRIQRFHRNGSTYRNRSFSIDLLFSERFEAIRNTTFESCLIQGPGSIVLSGGLNSHGNFVLCDFVKCDKNAAIRSAVLFDNCIFSECIFRCATLLLTPSAAQQFKEMAPNIVFINEPR